MSTKESYTRIRPVFPVWEAFNSRCPFVRNHDDRRCILKKDHTGKHECKDD